MDEKRELTWTDRPELDRPVMIVGLQGLFDAANAATDAIVRLGELHGAEGFAAVDPEHFFDFTQERPIVRFDDDGRRVIDWPENRLAAAVVPSSNDLVLLAGVEPHLRWRTFCGHLLDVAQGTGVEMVVTLGAMAGMAPHTRPLGVVGSATSTELATRLGLGRPSYEGPTGVVGALHDLLDRAGIPVISLRVSVPHYVPGPPNPEATRSLLARLELVTGIPTDHELLDQAAHDWRARVDAAVADDEDMRAYVEQLERQVDEADDILPSGDDLAAQLQAFLREQNPD